MFNLTSKSPASSFLVCPTLVKWDCHPIRKLSIIFSSFLSIPLHSEALTGSCCFCLQHRAPVHPSLSGLTASPFPKPPSFFPQPRTSVTASRRSFTQPSSFSVLSKTASIIFWKYKGYQLIPLLKTFSNFSFHCIKKNQSHLPWLKPIPQHLSVLRLPDLIPTSCPLTPHPSTLASFGFAEPLSSSPTQGFYASVWNSPSHCHRYDQLLSSFGSQLNCDFFSETFSDHNAFSKIPPHNRK